MHVALLNEAVAGAAFVNSSCCPSSKQPLGQLHLSAVCARQGPLQLNMAES